MLTKLVIRNVPIYIHALFFFWQLPINILINMLRFW